MALLGGASDGHGSSGCIIHIRNIDGGFICHAERTTATPVGERPVNLHAGRRGIRNVFVSNGGECRIDLGLRGIAVEGDEQLTPGVADVTNDHARQHGAVAYEAQGTTATEDILRTGSTVACQGNAGPGVVACAAVQRGQLGIGDLHAAVENDGGSVFGVTCNFRKA